ncbi:MAG TPA: RdgB/HAM1 family non-canonical purine NTP pyrophosphatase [Bacteroidota bacterium]|jgi:XTP/dITP diphosphohydrolase
MHPILLATKNPGKVREITSILSGLPVRITSLTELPDSPDVVEDGETLEANALKKASEIYARFRLPTIADDSGLEVFALGMRPGVLSARYAGEHVSYDENNLKLLRELSNVPPGARKARFRCVAAFVAAGVVRTAEGICAGSIPERPEGEGGFGYDPLFIPDGYDRTFAQLSAGIKNRISHRAIAFLQMKEILREYVNNFP